MIEMAYEDFMEKLAEEWSLKNIWGDGRDVQYEICDFCGQDIGIVNAYRQNQLKLCGTCFLAYQ